MTKQERNGPQQEQEDQLRETGKQFIKHGASPEASDIPLKKRIRLIVRLKFNDTRRK
jgi:hypothetical protein